MKLTLNPFNFGGKITKFRNMEGHSWKQCRSGKTISIAYYHCVFVVLGIHHAMRMPCIFICGPSGCTIFFQILPHKRHEISE